MGGHDKYIEYIIESVIANSEEIDFYERERSAERAKELRKELFGNSRPKRDEITRPLPTRIYCRSCEEYIGREFLLNSDYPEETVGECNRCADYD